METTVSTLNPYLLILIVMLIGLAIGATMSGLSLRVFGPRKPNKHKEEVYECGVPVKSSAENKFSVKFYLVAILFILFDIETIFMYLWASAFDYLKWFGIIEIGIFVATLVVGYIYIIRRRVLTWD